MDKYYFIIEKSEGYIPRYKFIFSDLSPAEIFLNQVKKDAEFGSAQFNSTYKVVIYSEVITKEMYDEYRVALAKNEEVKNIREEAYNNRVNIEVKADETVLEKIGSILKNLIK